ncbi:HTH-type transcriptional regulator DmlR [Sinobacterium norvegicum]|uniref:HTH-type transcriptional regulator DmlR n=1 Tax=Sinobacterium norvegicum TaxID=1641715 RepID=A0ABN8EKW8_9GAMM|nr:LysR family transcriptional regulator [Sinobacterium norvegicum]CAH0992037.1 HTH-type transcriptional regulator DmlR [Sinobacterium norvegicum]
MAINNWQGLDEFVAVVEAGSFTAAAKQLEVSTAHVSRSIHALEKKLAVKLLHRSTRQVNTTASGQIYYQQCRQLVDGLLEANRTATQLNTTPSGLIRVTAPIYYGEQVIAPLFSQLLSEYPDIELDLQLNNHNVDLIAEGFDLAIRLGELADSSLMARKIASRRFDVVGSPDYFGRHGQPHTIDELAGHNCLRGMSEHWVFQQHSATQPRQQRHHKDYRVTGNWRCNSGIAVATAAMDGIGLAQLPDYYTEQPVAQGKLIKVLSGYRREDEGIWAVYPQNRHLSTRLRLVIDFLVSALDKNRE